MFAIVSSLALSLSLSRDAKRHNGKLCFAIIMPRVRDNAALTRKVPSRAARLRCNVQRDTARPPMPTTTSANANFLVISVSRSAPVISSSCARNEVTAAAPSRKQNSSAQVLANFVIWNCAKMSREMGNRIDASVSCRRVLCVSGVYYAERRCNSGTKLNTLLYTSFLLTEKINLF